MKQIKIKDIIQTCEACPSQWDFVTEDNRVGYIRYRWGGLSVCLSVPFEMIVDNTTLFDIIKHSFDEWKRYTFGWGGFTRVLSRIFPNIREYGKELCINVYKYWLVKNEHIKLNKVSDIPKLFEFIGVSGREILYKTVGDSYDGFIEWPEVWDELQNVDYLTVLDSYVQRDDCIDERQWYIHHIENEKIYVKEARKEAKEYHKRMKNVPKPDINEFAGLVQVVSDEEKEKEKDNSNKMALSELMELGKLFNEGIEERKKENAIKRELKNKEKGNG